MLWIIVGLLVIAVLIVVILAVIGMVASRKESKAAAAASESALREPAVSVEPAPILEPVAAPPDDVPLEVEGGIGLEIVAVIAAAIAAMAPEGKRYALRRISRISQPAAGRSAWAMAGLLQNTKPF